MPQWDKNGKERYFRNTYCITHMPWFIITIKSSHTHARTRCHMAPYHCQKSQAKLTLRTKLTHPCAHIINRSRTEVIGCSNPSRLDVDSSDTPETAFARETLHFSILFLLLYMNSTDLQIQRQRWFIGLHWINSYVTLQQINAVILRDQHLVFFNISWSVDTSLFSRSSAILQDWIWLTASDDPTCIHDMHNIMFY